jgi:hypothetical protein
MQGEFLPIREGSLFLRWSGNSETGRFRPDSRSCGTLPKRTSRSRRLIPFCQEPAFGPRPFMNKLVFANLIHRPMRSIISAAAIAIEVVMIISVAAIFLGQIDGQKIRTNGIGADMIVRPPNSSFINGSAARPFPPECRGLRKLPHVAVASPVIQNFTLGSGTRRFIYGIDYESYNALRPFTFLEGGPFRPKRRHRRRCLRPNRQGLSRRRNDQDSRAIPSASAASSRPARAAARWSPSRPSAT